MRRAAVGLLLLSILGVSGSARGQSGNQLFEKALARERAEGNLDEAIKLYREIVQKYASNRALAAKALLQMGQCHEKLGNAEARKAYERVVMEFADQAEVAQEARTRLAGLGQPPAAPAIRQVWKGWDVDVLGSVSPDGRYLSHVDWPTGDLAIRDLATGERRRVTNKGPWEKSVGFALFSRFSPDGKQIAYDWMDNNFAWEMRVGAVDGTGHRTLYRNEKLDYMLTTAWFPDGKHVLAQLAGRDGTGQLAVVSVADGSARILAMVQPPRLSVGVYISLSPDGKYVVFDRAPSTDSPQHNLYLLSVGSGQEVRLTDHPASDQVGGWTPDGKGILFASDRTGAWDAWLLPMDDGKPAGPPQVVKRNVGPSVPLGFARNGAFYYGMSTGMVDVYVAPLELEAGKVGPAPARAAQRFIGSNRQPDWSPDGRQLAYVGRRSVLGVGPGGAVLYIADVETGKQHEVPARFDRAMQPRWSPDGRSILVRATPSAQKPGVYLVDPASGKSRLLYAGLLVRQAVWARDGKSIILARHPEGTPIAGKPAQIISQDIATEAVTELHREVAAGSPGDALLHDLDVSPDGRLLAFTASNGKDPKCLKVIPTAGGAAKPVHCAARGIPNFSGVSWSADGKELIFVRSTSPETPNQRELWAVAVTGGEPRRLSAAMEGLQDPRVQPGGKRISYTAGSDTREVWVMENLLPAR